VLLVAVAGFGTDFMGAVLGIFMIASPLGWALAAMLAWGVWAVVANVATRSLSPEFAMVVSYATGAALAAVYVSVQSVPVTLDREGLLFAALAGVFAGAGTIAFYVGLDRGRTGIVTTVSALYFVVAAVIGVVFLDETVTLRHVAGLGSAILAVVLLSG
jgi:transporter family protein